MTRWTRSDANLWWSTKPWICGFNFLPSTAVNFLEMWHPDRFDAATIERELGWAGKIGFNAIRVNLHALVWDHDPEGLLERLDWLMGVADRHGIATVPCFFDDCGFGGAEPTYGPQPDPVPGLHNSRAVASPGRLALQDRARWPGYESYVRGITRAFRNDARVLFWDLYNEPGNRMIFTENGAQEHAPDFSADSLALMRACFDWARVEAPEQPLTVGAWTTPLPGSTDAPYQTEIDRTALDLSDVTTFHAYWDAAHVGRFIDHLASLGRPMLCTEWMARPIGSRIDDQLHLFKSRSVGCFQWGLVKGRTQTHLPWPADLVIAHGGQTDRSIWFHDLLEKDGTPYIDDEAELIKALVRKSHPVQTRSG